MEASRAEEWKSIKNGRAGRMTEASRAEVIKKGRAGRIGKKAGKKAGIKAGKSG